MREIIYGNNIFLTVGNNGKASYSSVASTPVSTSQSSNISTTYLSSCQNLPSLGSPDLFQIDVANTQATLYFAPVDGANNYFISYGEGQSTQAHGALFDSGVSTGVLFYTVNHLQPNTTYSFKVRGGNNCMPGGWGNIMQVKTRNTESGGRVFYKNLLTKILSVSPQQITNLTSGSSKPTALNASSCEYAVKSGDSLWNISSAKYGTGVKYRQIMEENGLQTTMIRTGQVLKVGC